MKQLKVAAFAAAILMMGACGVEQGSSTQGRGQLSVLMHGLEDAPADVDRVEVSVYELPGETLLETKIVSESPWKVVFAKLLFGDYSVTAIAYDIDDNVLFASNPTSVEVREGGDPVVQLFLLQNDQTSEETPPQFVSVTLDKEFVYLNEDLQIRVEADGGKGALSLHGRFYSGACKEGGVTIPGSTVTDSWGNVECVKPPATTYGSFEEAEGYDLIWNAPSEMPVWANEDGPYVWLVLVLEDEAKNISEVGVTVPVRNDGSENHTFAINFHTAPSISAESRVLNDGDASNLYLKFLASSYEATAMDYTLEATCDYTMSKGGGETGTTNSGVRKVFELEVLGEDRGTCDVTYSVEDSAGLKSSHTLHLITAEIEADVLP